MRIFIFIAFMEIIIFLADISFGNEHFSGNETFSIAREKLSRKKRYLAFPTGTNFVTTITLLKAIQVNEPKNWNLDLEFDMIWPIPNQEKFRKKSSRRTKISHRTRRHKRDLYRKIELALTSQGLPGTRCLLRTICEANIYLNSPGVSFLDDILRIFLSHDERGQELDEYDVAYKKKMDCDLEYPCPISILHFLLNSNPVFSS